MGYVEKLGKHQLLVDSSVRRKINLQLFKICDSLMLEIIFPKTFSCIKQVTFFCLGIMFAFAALLSGLPFKAKVMSDKSKVHFQRKLKLQVH